MNYEQEIRYMKIAFLKKLLFWIAYAPIIIAILSLAVLAAAFEFLDKGFSKLTCRFEQWCFR